MARPAALVFSDRAQAGRLLTARLVEESAVGTSPVVLGLPRGGVAVAVEVADALGGELDVVLARKLGHPDHPELALGALGDDGQVVWDHALLTLTGRRVEDLADVVAAERVELARRQQRYRGDRPPLDVSGREVVVVDDGVATGSTARAALRSLRAQGPVRLVLAVPVAAEDSLESLADESDGAVAVSVPDHFRAVGQWYADFHQLTDEDVLALLRR
jgi:predicted phosphoribosyltransferase